MTKNKPQNLEELIEEITANVHGSSVPHLKEMLREVARATCDAVGLESQFTGYADVKPSDVEKTIHQTSGWNSAVKAQKDKERSWMGEGETNRG